MSQFSWTLLDDFGKQYEIGLYYGVCSKYILIHVNRKLIVEDFNVEETKKYSFYVGHEFCEMKLQEDNDQFSYSFISNHDVDTPLNLARKQQSRKYFIFLIVLGIALLLFILRLSYWMIAISDF